jgi:outer membrane lipoprotein
MEDAATKRIRKTGLKETVIGLACAVGLLGLLGCTVISHRMMAEADTDVTFSQLKADTDRYEGQTVILGGHIIEVRNKARETVLVVLETPLGSGQEPRPPDRSQGRFMLHCEGFLDPEVYAEGRTITVAGRVLGQTREMIGEEPYAYPTLEAREIYLWERYEDRYRYPPPYPPPFYDPWYYRHRRYGYPYR